MCHVFLGGVVSTFPADVWWILPRNCWACISMGDEGGGNTHPLKTQKKIPRCPFSFETKFTMNLCPFFVGVVKPFLPFVRANSPDTNLWMRVTPAFLSMGFFFLFWVLIYFDRRALGDLRPVNQCNQCNETLVRASPLRALWTLTGSFEMGKKLGPSKISLPAFGQTDHLGESHLGGGEGIPALFCPLFFGSTHVSFVASIALAVLSLKCPWFHGPPRFQSARTSAPTQTFFCDQSKCMLDFFKECDGCCCLWWSCLFFYCASFSCCLSALSKKTLFWNLN